MKEIDYYIKSNMKLMQEKQEEYNKLYEEEHLAFDDMRLCELRTLIASYKYYISGLVDAKRYIEKERGI